MAGLKAGSPKPLNMTVHGKSRVLEVAFTDGKIFRIPFELMRVYSPSAEVQGHGPGQEVLQTGKREVELVGLEPVGNYAVQPAFSDGHSSGLYTWDYLYLLGSQESRLWAEYEAKLQAAGLNRDAPMPASAGHGQGGHACGHHH
ncbi:gamma-butyrobetaine hydroxylase-like domain-containing protein [Hylemonella sp. W303a]|uniref:gamma-butyrobetaine hydroxylase-like domain-containing protein n=1 Tax=Hylemonella sp. W303a TaxID=3389873 RepID=UPI00396B2CFD